MYCISRDKCQRRKRRRRCNSDDNVKLTKQKMDNIEMSETIPEAENASEDISRCQSVDVSKNDLRLLEAIAGMQGTRLVEDKVVDTYPIFNGISDIRTLKQKSRMHLRNEYGSTKQRRIKCLKLPDNFSLQSLILYTIVHLMICISHQTNCQRPLNTNDQSSTDQTSLASNTMDQLINLIKNLETNNNQNIRRSPLPLTGRGSQTGMQQVSPQQQGFPIPLNGQQFMLQQQQQQQQSNNNRRVNFAQPMFSIASSPPTPYLTLNRITNQQQLANNQQQQQQNKFNSANNQLPQPIATNPLLPQNGNRPGNVPQMMAPSRGTQPGILQRPQQQPPLLFNQAQLAGIPKPSLAPNLLQLPSNGPPVRPITGFAPSGPPPSSAANSAMTVVQSPSNVIGQAASSNRPIQSEPPQQPLTVTNKTVAEDENKLPTTASTPQTETQTSKDNLTVSSSTATISTVTSTPPTPGDNTSDSSSNNGYKQDEIVANASSPIDDANTRSNNKASTDSLSQAATTQTATTAVTISANGNQEKPNNGELSSTAKESSWNPVDGNRTSVIEQANNRSKLAPSPDIVTVPPGYNPDNPSNSHNGPQAYDVSVSAQMGGPTLQTHPARPQVSAGETPILATPVIAPQDTQTSSMTQNIAPTAVTTIIWTAPPTDIVQLPSTTTAPPQPPVSSSVNQSKPTNTLQLSTATRVRDNSLVNANENSDEQPDSGVVYGKPQTRDSKPLAPSTPAASSDNSAPGKPFIQPAQMDNQVRPFSAGAAPSTQQQQTQSQSPGSVVKSNHHHPPAFRPSRPLTAGNQQSPMRVGSGFTIAAAGNQTMPIGDIQDYVAAQPPLLVPSQQQPGTAQSSFQVGSSSGGEPVISAQGGPDPASFDLGSQESSSVGLHKPSQTAVDHHHHKPSVNSSSARNETPTQPIRRRPTFKPKPAEPPIRIDSCIVDDDSSCDQSHNERCVTEYGISSCHCKPGFARLSQLRGYCSPVSLLQLSMKIDRLSDDRRLVYNHTLNNTNTEEYQYLEFETIQALASAFQQTALAKHFMGARVNKFFERKGKVWANVSINFASNATKADKLQSFATTELLKVTQSNQRPLGDSTIMLDGSKETVSRLVDVNECASRDLNDCSKYATCTNDLGGFQCKCMAGFEDKYASSEDKAKHGRVCLGCSPSYCSNRGECSIFDGQKQCKCRPNFVGARCDYDTEVLAVAVGGSIIGVIILVVTCWCLYIFNRRWKREQQKMDAMSATSGLTYNYINSASTNSLMSPTRIVGGLHRSGGHQVGSMAANYGQRFGAALANQTSRGDQHYAPDQQAIIGSSSSGSSAASQPIGGCNPYAAGGYQYEDVGLLIASASTGSSEQTSPTSNSYRDMMTTGGPMQLNYQMQAGNAYTLSGHHHHHNHQHHHANQTNMHHRHTGRKGQQQFTQFHPAAAEYRTLNASGTMICQPPGAAANNYDNRWRTLRQEHNKQSNLVGYYLNQDTLSGQQQLYASPKRVHCDWN